MSTTPATAAVTARAPGRVNLIGEHTDYNGGLCLPFAIDLTTTVRVTRRADDHVVATSNAPEADPGWTRYVDGVVWALREAGWDVPGLDVAVRSDVPLGGGLSSSAALECAVATAVAALLDQPLDPATRRLLADASRRAETEYVGAPTGGMDQLASMLGEQDHLLLIDFADPADPTVRPVPFPVADEGLALMVTDTGVRHRLADGDGGYAQRRRECEDGDPRRLRHVASENQRVDAAVAAIAAGEWTTLGRLMTESHASLRDDYEVSCVELDVAVDAALAAGALGARLTGGGFGGCTITLAAADRVGGVRDGIDATFAAAGFPTPTHREVRPGPGAGVVT